MTEPKTIEELYQFTKEALAKVIDKIGGRIAKLEKEIDRINQELYNIRNQDLKISTIESKVTETTSTASDFFPTPQIDEISPSVETPFVPDFQVVEAGTTVESLPESESIPEVEEKPAIMTTPTHIPQSSVITKPPVKSDPKVQEKVKDRAELLKALKIIDSL